MMEVDLDRAGGLWRELDWLGGGTEEDLSCCCSQRFFRALRLPDRKDTDTLSEDSSTSLEYPNVL